MEREGSVKRGTNVLGKQVFLTTQVSSTTPRESLSRSRKRENLHVASKIANKSVLNRNILSQFSAKSNSATFFGFSTVSYRHVGAHVCSLLSILVTLSRFVQDLCSSIRSESRVYSPLAWAARRSLSCCWPVVNSTQLTLTLNLAPVLCLCSDIPRNSQAIAQGIAPRVWPASGVPSIVWDFPAKRKTDCNTVRPILEWMANDFDRFDFYPSLFDVEEEILWKDKAAVILHHFWDISKIVDNLSDPIFITV